MHHGYFAEPIPLGNTIAFFRFDFSFVESHKCQPLDRDRWPSFCIEDLINIAPSAALAYLQAVVDLADEDRISYRGVANEFRETLRETMDGLAPDEEIMQQPGFKLEANRATPQ